MHNESLKITSLPYQADSTLLWEQLATLPWPVLLDSGMPQSHGRYDILSAKPYATLCTWGNHSQLCYAGNTRWSSADPWELLQELMQYAHPLHADVPPDIPFSGGAIGYFGYDLVRRLETLPTQAVADIHQPDLALGFYNWAIVVDHLQQHTQLVCRSQCDDEYEFLLTLLNKRESKPQHTGFTVLTPLQADISKQCYLRGVQQIKDFLHAGDCYQVNLAQRFRATIEGSSLALYRSLRQLNPSPFGALLETPYASILSYSPERFLQVKQRHVITQPIKGTIPRDPDLLRDQQLAMQLQHSMKDRTENVMVVDLLRNDLSKSCVPGSVQVAQLYELQSFSNVHHLVSTISGCLAPNKTSIDLLRDCFPGGSITGVPKIRAMQIIEGIEPCRRNLYCGSIGYIDTCGNMDCNIAIRSIIRQQQHLFCYAGGAIVADSSPELEYTETLAKISWLFRGLNGKISSAYG